ncbi:hypothetical protein FH972_026356 [Carpinus fangiana]|uniref:Uncharacterized protein n=1 Tax=Carpinus fangiana TaxID=176857 RepID=A0A5N6L488_9ROSI|nr:hypothetical protein FH972_026356 [Carpinus fangiana]
MRREAFTVGWICALQHELAASRAMLDEEFNTIENHSSLDDNVYTWGALGGHNVVMACLSAGKFGTESAATVAKDMLRSFPSIRFGLMVGIGGGVPSETDDIRLGDVVVSKPTDVHGGVIQYDFGKILPNGAFQRKGHMNKPPAILLNAMQKIQSTHEMHGSKLQTHLLRMRERFPAMRDYYESPGSDNDHLFSSDYGPMTSSDHESKKPTEIRRLPRSTTEPCIHYGLIASGSKVMASAEDRDRLRKENRILCFEMEAAGLMDSFPCLAIRGISDYADVYKQDKWQKFAAATAAAYARELLGTIPTWQVETTAKAEDQYFPYQPQSRAVPANPTRDPSVSFVDNHLPLDRNRHHDLEQKDCRFSYGSSSLRSC